RLRLTDFSAAPAGCSDGGARKGPSIADIRDKGALPCDGWVRALRAVSELGRRVRRLAGSLLRAAGGLVGQIGGLVCQVGGRVAPARCCVSHPGRAAGTGGTRLVVQRIRELAG